MLPSSCRLPLALDLAPLVRELGGLDASEWVPHFGAERYAGEWSGAALRARGGDPRALSPDGAAGDFRDTPLLARCPAMAAALARLRSPLRSVRLLRLGPGARIAEHRDHRLGAAFGFARLHLPLVSGPGAAFWLEGVRLALLPGELWYLDLDRRHRADNAGPADRVHLVIDCVADRWLRAQLERAVE